MLAITGGKGGCGKTTTAVGLARALAARGLSPLLVDGDSDMPDIHHHLEIRRQYGVDALACGAPLSRAVQRTNSLPGVAIVTAGKPDRVPAALRATANWDGPVLVDCPAGIGPDATRPLRAADTCLVVSTDEPQCLEDTVRTLAVARQLGATPAGAVLRVVADDHRPQTIGDCPVRERVPTVESPNSHLGVSQAWSRLADEFCEGVLAVTPRRPVGKISQ